MKNLSKIAFLLALSFSLFVTSCDKSDDANLVTEKREVAVFTTVEIAENFNIILLYDPYHVPSLVVEGTAEAVADVVSEVDANGNLLVTKTPQSAIDCSTVDLKITVPKIEGIAARNGGRLMMGTLIPVENLKIEVENGGNWQGMFRAKKLEVKASGKAVMTFLGQVDNANIQLDGVEAWDSKAMPFQTCSLNLNNESFAQVYVNQQLLVNVAGSSTVYYTGNATLDASSTIEVNSSVIKY